MERPVILHWLMTMPWCDFGIAQLINRQPDMLVVGEEEWTPPKR